jgi:hypothetical protein
MYLAHRLAWFYVNGCWPRMGLDHVNLDGLDNRLSNLREATKAENQRNTRPPRTNKSGVKGVFWRRDLQKWRAAITINGKSIHLGVFVEKRDAAESYRAAALTHFGPFAGPCAVREFAGVD